MFSRANLAIVSWVGIIIVVGLIMTHGTAAKGETDSVLGGLRGIFATLENPGGH